MQIRHDSPILIHILKIFLVSFLISTILYYLYTAVTQPYYQSDYRSFYAAAQIILNNPEQLYDLNTQTLYQQKLIPENLLSYYKPTVPFANPPLFLVPFLPLTYLNPATGYIIAMIANLIILIITLVILNKIFPIKHHKFFILISIFSFTQTIAIIILAQSSFITLMIYVLIYYLLHQNKLFLTGITASLLLYKPQLGLVLYIYFLIKKEWKIIFGLIIGSFITFIFSFVITKGNLFGLIPFLIEFVDHPGTTPINRISWLGFFTQIQYFYQAIPSKLLAIIASFATIIWGLKKIHKIPIKSVEFPKAYIIIILITLLSVIHVHAQEAVLLLIPLFYVFSQHRKPPVKFYIITTLGWLAFCLYTYSPFYPHPTFFIQTLFIFSIFIAFLRYA